MQAYIPPNDIHIEEVLNNRQINPNYVEDLKISMEDKGFLPEFPVDVFLTENLTNIESNLRYICASGHHRILAARAAKLDGILCNVHSGREEAFVEVMHLANFEFDPIQNSGIGQTFTQKEKRAAVHQLLLLPKYFEMTNAALVQMWRIPDSSIRRWREEVVAMLTSNSPKLRMWGVSDGRIERIRQLAETPERKDAAGKIVKIRKPSVEPTEAEKEAAWDLIIKDVGTTDDGWLRTSGVLSVNYLKDFVMKKFETPETWNIHRHLTMKQILQIHRAIIEEDPEFMAECAAFAEAAQASGKIREEIRKLSTDIKKWLMKLVKSGEYSQDMKNARAKLEATVREHHPEYRFDPYDYKLDEEEGVEKRKAIVKMLRGIAHEIDLDFLWVVEFREDLATQILNKRKRLIKKWVDAKEDLKNALAAYKTPLDLSTVCMVLDDEYHVRDGTFMQIMKTDTPSNRVHADTIADEARRLAESAKDVTENAGWVQEIAPAQTVTAADSTETPIDVIFESIKSRLPEPLHCLGSDDEFDARGDIFAALGKIGSGSLETQLFHIADIGQHLAKCLKEAEESE